MVKLRHYDNDGRARFVTFSAHQRIPILTNSRSRQVIVDSIDESRRRFGFQLAAYVIMPEHVHLVMIPAVEMKMGQVIGEIKRMSSKRIHEFLLQEDNDLIPRLTVRRNGEYRFAFWQKRCYDHNIRSEESLWEKVNYCHYNPVKRGLVKEPEAWEWSSYRWYQGCRDVKLEMDVLVEEKMVPHPTGAKN
ncbi:MAG: transposase [Candidatus Zixiibacteriota bacterium]|nr:MAG: transposase [candidate division Zixibacteria bacterium]